MRLETEAWLREGEDREQSTLEQDGIEGETPVRNPTPRAGQQTSFDPAKRSHEKTEDASGESSYLRV